MKVGNRYYFDFNSTAPMAASVRRWLAVGDFPQGNPASTHSMGKKARREMDQVTEFLQTTFELPERRHRLFFHSGASEGIVTLLTGFGEGRPFHFFHLTTDHPCVTQTAHKLNIRGHSVHSIPVDKSGLFDERALIKRIQSCSAPVLFNCTWVNNETGVVIPLEQLSRIKEQTGCTIHVDAVQAIGKIPKWNRPVADLDAYTFSGHKFGALKGCGFSFVSETFSLAPLIPPGPGRPLRGGTENLPGIISLKLALEELRQHYCFEKQVCAKNLLEQKLNHLLGDRGEIVASDSPRNGNTIQLILHNTSSQISALAFSMAGIDVSSGSACASGSPAPSPVLSAMGHSEHFAKNALRFSFSPQFHESQVEEYYQKIAAVLARFIDQED